MNAITNRRPAVAIPAVPPNEPALPQPIAHAVAGMLSPIVGRGQFGADDPGHYVAPKLVSRSEWLTAQALAERYDTLLAPVTTDVIAAWLIPVNAASRNPQSPQDFALRVAGIAEMVADLPAAAFTAEARRRLDTGFFPSHEDVRAAIEPTSEQWVRKRDALRSLRQREEPPTQRGPTDPSERAAIAAGLAQLSEELSAAANAKAAQDRASTSKSLPLSERDLLAHYDLSASPAMRYRAEQLRKALEA